MRPVLALVLVAVMLSACESSCRPTITTARTSGAVVVENAFESGTVSARLTTEQKGPLGSRTLHFSIKGEDAGTAVTRTDGLAKVDLKRGPGKFLKALTAREFQAEFFGDGFYCGSNGTGAFKIVKR